MNKSDRKVILRSVRGDFVRIIGLKKEERDKLATRLQKMRSASGVSIVIRYALNGWLEISQGGLNHLSLKKRTVIVDALLERVKDQMGSEFSNIGR